jgi:hypothetical protein
MATLRLNLDPLKVTWTAVGLSGVTMATCLLLTAMRMRADKTFLSDQSVPSLSQTADVEPGRTLFAMGLTVSSLLFLVAAYFRFTLVALLFRNSPTMQANGRLRLLNLLSMVLAFLYALSLAVVACFDSRDFYAFHVDASYAFFATAMCFNFLQTYLDWHVVHPLMSRLRHREQAPTLRLFQRRFAKIALMASSSACSLVLLILVVAHANYSVAAVFEWLTMLQLLLFWIAVGEDFRDLTVSMTSRIADSTSGRVVQLP